MKRWFTLPRVNPRHRGSSVRDREILNYPVESDKLPLSCKIVVAFSLQLDQSIIDSTTPVRVAG